MFYRDNGSNFGSIGFHSQHSNNGAYAWQMASTSYTDASSIQARVKNNGTWTSPVTIWNSGNDGSGSGLDADTVDGLQASQFLRSDTNATMTGQLTISGSSPQMKFNDTSSGEDDFWIHINQNNFYVLTDRDDSGSWDGTYPLQLNNANSTIQSYGNTVWTSGNDGSGSGLDADTVDGIQGSSFLRSDADDTMSGNLTLTGTVTMVDAYPEFMRITVSNDTGYAQFSFGSASSPTTTGTHMINTAAGLFQIKTGHPVQGSATKQLEIDTSGNLTATGNVTAYSDERLKSDIKTLDGSKVYEMRGVSFTKDGAAGSGVIAQELQKVAPELVQDDGEYLSVAYGNVVGYLIEAIKELKTEVDDLKTQLAEKG